jgi:hypothetical protein
MKKFTQQELKNTYLVSSDNEFYDDCPVCRLMKNAEKEGRFLSLEEVEEAFEKANNQNQFVRCSGC